jgi:putative acetyltransferase
MVDVRLPDFEIRAATDADATGIFLAHVESIVGLCAKDYTPEQIRAWVDVKEPQNYLRAMKKGEVMFVAIAEGKVIGFASRKDGELTGVYVHPAHIGRGTGKALLATVERDALTRGIRHLELDSTLTAVAFYERNGFRWVNAKMFTIHPSGVELECIRMSKDLAPTIAGS